MVNLIRKKRTLRQRRVRAQLQGTSAKPRLAVFRSNRNIELQLVDDTQGKTLVSVTSLEVKDPGNKTEKADLAGKLLAKKALEVGIKEAVFDRRHYRYHGRIKAVAEGARQGGLKI
ncbi:MAG: 50S ribosomal protein L18 [bacterium]|nr:50S ribosomal protein L18 [bacterium]MDZ4231517.1 50S ribosomal protein L18 [Patescibacteria group bacterium]